MTWVAWRQYRLELIFAMALLVALAAFLVPTGLDIFDRFEASGLKACLDSAPADCASLGEGFMMNSYGRFALVLDGLTLLPAILGVLLASPMLLELEQRTYRLVWTQSVTRRRWLAIKLGLAMFGALALSGIVVLLMNWWLGPLDRVSDPFWGQLFSMRGIVPAAYTVFCLALALAAGAFWRRMVPAIIVTLVGFFVAVLWVGDALRPVYLAPVEVNVPVDAPSSPSRTDRAYVVEGIFVDANGDQVSDARLEELCTPSKGGNQPREADWVACLEGNGVHKVLRVQPADRFWTFQAIEAGIFLAAALPFLGLTVWAVTTRSRWRLA